MDEMTAEYYTGLLDCLKAKMTSPRFMTEHRRSVKDFSRKRCLTFVIVLMFLMNMIKRALQDELDEFFKGFSAEPVACRQVSKSAFTQARQKLKHTAFIALNTEQVNYFYDHFDVQRFNGFRLLAFDGSMANLPHTQKVCEHFGVWHPAAGGTCPKARISQMFDVQNRVTVEALIAPKSEGERSLAAQHCQHLVPMDLVLLDRGYPAFWLFVAISAEDADFCARMPIGKWNVVEQFIACGQREQIVELTPSYPAKKACQALKLSTQPLTIRLIRLQLKNGDPFVLATSLVNTNLYPYSFFTTLYPCRWPVETDYRQMKFRLEVENWSGTSVEAIYQDFHAIIFTKNLASLLAQPAQQVVAQQTRANTHDYRVNMANLFSKMKDTVVFLFTFANPLPVLHKLWLQMTQTIEPIRPNRTFQRNKHLKPRRFPMNYKPLR